MRSYHVHRACQAPRARRHRCEGRGSREHSVEERGSHFSEGFFPIVIPSVARDLHLIDANALIGPYPFRHVPHPDAEILDRVVERDGLEGAWVGHLPSAWHRDPSHGNEELFKALEKHPRLKPVPTIRPDWPKWDEALAFAEAKGAVAIRAYPQHWGLGPGDRA